MGSIDWDGHDPQLLDKELVSDLQLLAGRLPFGIVVTSGYRQSDPRAHSRGAAVDFKPDVAGLYNKLGHMKGWYVWQVVYKGNWPPVFRRLGVYDKHFHVDIAERTIDDKSYPAPVMWVGTSR